MSDPRKNDRLVVMCSYVFIPIVPTVIWALQATWPDNDYKQNVIQSFLLGMLLLLINLLLKRTGYAGVIGLGIWIYSIITGIRYFMGRKIEIPVLTQLGKTQGWF